MWDLSQILLFLYNSSNCLSAVIIFSCLQTFACYLYNPVYHCIVIIVCSFCNGNYSQWICIQWFFFIISLLKFWAFWFQKKDFVIFSILLGYLWGYIRSLSKFKNIPKALISGQKSTLIFRITLTFSSKKPPLLLSKHWHWMNGNTHFNFCYNSLPV